MLVAVDAQPKFLRGEPSQLHWLPIIQVREPDYRIWYASRSGGSVRASRNFAFGTRNSKTCTASQLLTCFARSFDSAAADGFVTKASSQFQPPGNCALSLCVTQPPQPAECPWPSADFRLAPPFPLIVRIKRDRTWVCCTIRSDIPWLRCFGSATSSFEVP